MPPTPNATTLSSGLWVVWWALGIGLWVWLLCWPQVGSKFLNSGIEIILDSCNFVTAYHDFWNQGLKLLWIQATLLLYVMMLAPSWLQVGPNLAPSWLQIGSKLAPSWHQVGSKVAPSGPNIAQVGPEPFLLLFTALRGCQGHHAAAVHAQSQFLLIFTAVRGGQGRFAPAWCTQSPFLLLFTRL